MVFKRGAKIIKEINYILAYVGWFIQVFQDYFCGFLALWFKPFPAFLEVIGPFFGFFTPLEPRYENAKDCAYDKPFACNRVVL